MPWTHIILEGYCMYKSMSNKIWRGYELKKNGKTSKTSIKIKNKNYTPKYKRPKWCKSKNKRFIPQFRCLCNGKYDKKCTFFAFCNANKKDYLIFDKAWEKSIK